MCAATVRVEQQACAMTMHYILQQFTSQCQTCQWGLYRLCSSLRADVPLTRCVARAHQLRSGPQRAAEG
jgi:hypothetical protein